MRSAVGDIREEDESKYSLVSCRRRLVAEPVPVAERTVEGGGRGGGGGGVDVEKEAADTEARSRAKENVRERARFVEQTCGHELFGSHVPIRCLLLHSLLPHVPL